MTQLQDKKAIMHVFSGLLKEPSLLGSAKGYKLNVEDFPEKFHKIIFAGLFNLYSQGVEKITPVEIDGYLSNYDNQYRIYNDNGGIEYLYKLEELGEIENFDYHFNRIKKFSFLRSCILNGIDVSDFYDHLVVDVKESEKQQFLFDAMSLNDMIKHIELKMVSIKEDFLHNNSKNHSHMGDNVRDIIAEAQLAPNYGYNLASAYLNFISRGARLGAFYLLSGNTGSGKTRHGLANLFNACIPEIWDSESKSWVLTGATGRGLFITTENDEKEIKIPAICYIAEVNEEKFHSASLTKEEKERVNRAVEILEQSNIWFEELMDFDIEDISETLERNILKNGVDVIVFDYIHSSLKLLTSLTKSGVKNLREDQVLLLISIKLKNIATEHQVFIQSSTQLNNKYKEEGNMDQSSIRGSSAVADKIDLGAIMLPISTKDIAVIEAVKAGGGQIPFGVEPTHTINVYKNRGNRYVMCRIWIAFDTGTLRMKDLFVTDYQNAVLSNIKTRRVIFTKKPSETQPEQKDSLPDAFLEEAKPSEKFAF